MRAYFSMTALATAISMLLVHQSFAAAKAPDVDPSRYSIGNIVFPPGAKPAAGTETFQNGEVVKDKPSTAITIQPKAKHKAKHKSAE
jgi:hypothetical protein